MHFRTNWLQLLLNLDLLNNVADCFLYRNICIERFQHHIRHLLLNLLLSFATSLDKMENYVVIQSKPIFYRSFAEGG